MSAAADTPDTPDTETLRSLFEHSRPLTFGAEEEVMVLDPQTLDLAPCAAELLDGAAHGGVKLELPASQLEIVTEPRNDVGQLVEDLYRGRVRLSEAVAGRARLAAAGTHPFTAAEGKLNSGRRYERMEREYGAIARRQLVCGLHVHVGLGGAARVLAVYNAMRALLPELAALGANAPLHAGRDCGLASVRPFIAGMLPRQGVPPSYRSWEELAADLEWGARAGRLEQVRGWWWELRIHAELGTLEVRVPDAQSTVDDAAAIVATVCALVLWLAELHDARELSEAAPSWRIAENRWSAARHGVGGQMIDLQTGELTATRERLHALLDRLEPFAACLGAAEHLHHAHRLADLGGADRQRGIFAEHGPRGLVSYLAERFEDPPASSAQALVPPDRSR